MTRLKSAKQSANMGNRLRTLEENQKSYKQMVEQPLILALKSTNPESAIALLERGADPNVVTSTSQYYMQASWYSRFTAETALDLANKHLKVLREYKGEASLCPRLPDGADTYLEKFKEGTYQHWVVSKEIDKLREKFQKDLKVYEENKADKTNKAPGVEEKESAIAEAIKTMEKVKEVLLAKGAKTFVEAYPEFKDRFESASTNHWNYGAMGNKTAEPYKFTFSFANVNDVTEARKEAYLKL